MSDASLTGIGVVSASFDSDSVSSIGTTNEKWRYAPLLPAPRPRDAALSRLDPFHDVARVRRTQDQLPDPELQVNRRSLRFDPYRPVSLEGGSCFSDT